MEEIASQPLSIKGVSIAPRLVLAPMSGVTNSCFRRLVKSLNPGAVGLLVTEFISVEGLTRQNQQSLRMMRFAPEERAVSVQIFGHEVSRMVEAAKMVEASGADIIDINSGCPVPKVVRRGGGCELMRQPEHMEKLLTAVQKAVSIPLTLKIRAGWDLANRNALQIARIAEGCGVAMLSVHGRTRAEGYRGSADWGLIGEVARSVSIPVIGSGDVVDGDSAKRAFATGVSGVMIGRAALSNPWVFSEVLSALEGRAFVRPSAAATAEVLVRYAELLLAELPEKAVIGRLKQLASQVTRRVRGTAHIRRELCRSSSVDQFREQLARWSEELNHFPERYEVLTAASVAAEERVGEVEREVVHEASAHKVEMMSPNDLCQ